MKKQYNYHKQERKSKSKNKKEKKSSTSRSKSKTKTKNTDTINNKSKSKIKLNKKTPNILLEKKLNEKTTIDNFKNNLTNEEKDQLVKNCIEELESEKISIKQYNVDSNSNENNNEKIKKSHNKKYLTIDVEENIESPSSVNNETNTGLIEVKNRKFNNINDIDKRVLYDGYVFYEDPHKPQKYPQISNYRCSNYRKNERLLKNQFCNALLKRKEEKNTIYFILEKNHSDECIKLHSITKKTETNLIGNYNDYINKCFKYLDSTEEYNKKEFTIKLQNIYNENKYDFRLKENTIKNIISRWKTNSLRFTKYSAIENRFNKKEELILWEYNNSSIFTSNKKNPIPSEYFIWSSDQMIARSRLAKHLFIDGTFHHPVGFSQLLIIIFKDIVTSKYLPCFYILMSNKTEIIYDMIFKSIIRILTQNNIYNLDIKTITTDTEIALINSIKTNFPKSQRIGCWFHLKQDLMREARVLGLFNPKNNNINPETTLEVITQLSLLPIEYDGNINYLIQKLDILSKQYPNYYNMINGYFKETKLKYFQDDSYNYNQFPKDIRANSILERYNNIVKRDLGEKRTCNGVIFLNFINNEIIRINNELIVNQNINVLYNAKNTKFGLEKYNKIDNNDKLNNAFTNEIHELIKENISNKLLMQRGYICRYNTYITLFYFTITPYLKENKNNNYILLNGLNEKIIKLSEDVNDINYINIVIFLQKNKFYTINAKIDAIINEEDAEKKKN